MTLWDHCCCVGYGLQARIDALGHLFRGHKLHWRDSVELWIGVTGDIWCEECPDTPLGEDGRHVGCQFWIRQWSFLWWLAGKLCAALGHPGWRHPKRWSRNGDPLDDGEMVDADGWYCIRCLTDGVPNE